VSAEEATRSGSSFEVMPESVHVSSEKPISDSYGRHIRRKDVAFLRLLELKFDGEATRVFVIKTSDSLLYARHKLLRLKLS